MSDTINTIVDKKAFDQIASLAIGLKDARLELVKLLEAGKGSPINVKTYADLGKHLDKNASSYKKVNEQQRESERLNQALVKAQAKRVLVESNTNKILQKTRFETNQLNKQYREQAVLSSKLATEYQKQSVVLNQLRRKYKDVALTQGESSKAARRLQKDIQTLDQRLKRVDGNVGQFQRSVGNYGNAMKGLGNVVRSTAAAFGLMGGAFMAVQILRNGVRRIREFDKEMQNMAGIVRGTREELADLEQEIIDVASVSIKTSNEVAKLATSLLTLGKTKDEVKLLLKPVNDLSIGLNATSDEAGEFLVQTLNSFGKGAESAEEFADIIATIRTSTSLDFQKMRDSFQYLSPISRALGKDLAYTGAVIGILADNGLKAEQAGRLLGTAQQRLASEGRTLADALQEINQAQANGEDRLKVLARASKLFGAQAGKVGVILANNTEIIEKNAQAIRDNTGALKDLTDKQLESLDAKIKILDSTWEQFILNIENGKGSISQFFKGAIEGATKFLKFLDKINGSASERRQASAYTAALDGIKEEAEKTGRSVEEVAAESVDAYDDEVYKIEEKIRKLKEENAEIEKRNSLESLKNASVSGDREGGDHKSWQENTQAIEESSKRLDIYKGMLEAAITLEGSAAEEGGKSADSNIENGNKVIETERKKVEAIGETTKQVKFTVKWFDELISQLEEARKNTARGSKEWEMYEDKLKQLTSMRDNIKDIGPFTIPESEFEFFERQQIEKGMQSLSQILGEGTKELYEEFGEDYELDYENFKKFFEKKVKAAEEGNEKMKLSTEDYMNMAADMIYNVGNLFAAISDNKVQKIDDEIAKQDEQYERWLENEQLSDRQRKILEDQRKAEKEKLEKEKKKEQIKAARTAKAFAMFDIALSTASAIIGALRPPPVGLGPVAGIPMSIAVGAMGALQIATVAAKPIPKYKHGRTDGPAEAAIVGDGGRQEVVTDKYGNFKYITPDKPTFTYLEEGDRVHKSVSDYDHVMRASVMASLNSQHRPEQAQQTFDNELMIQTIKEGFRNVQMSVSNHNDNSELLKELRFQRRRDAI